MPGENPSPPSAPPDAPKPGGSWSSRLMDRGETILRRILAPLRPRVSLASGSVLVLLTLFLPIGYESCGPERKGYDLLQGEGDWPTFMGIFFSDYFGPAFYAIAIALAVLTVVLTVISLWKPLLFQSPPLRSRLLIVSGTLSLFLISDVLAILPAGADEYGAAAGALIVISCLLPGKFWPKGIFWRWFGVLLLAVLILLALTALNWVTGDVPAWFMVGIVAIYMLVPLALWWAGLAGKLEATWKDVRRGLFAFYLPGMLGNLWFFVVAWREGVWGFVPFSVGLYLMALGYMALARAPLEAANNDIAGFPPEISRNENPETAQS